MKKILIAAVLGWMSVGAYAAEFPELQNFKAQDVESLGAAVPAPSASKGANDHFNYPGIGMILPDETGQDVYSHSFGDRLAVLPAVTAIWAWFADGACAAGAGYKIEVENFSGYKNLRVSSGKLGVVPDRVTLTSTSTAANLPGDIQVLYVDGCNGGVNAGRNPIIKISVLSSTCSEKYAFRAKVFRDKWGDARMDSGMVIATFNKN